MTPKGKNNPGSMSRGKVREELRRCRGENELLKEKLRRAYIDQWWAEAQLKLIEGSGD